MSVTLILLIATVLVSVLSFQNESLREKLIFNPFIIEQERQWYRFISSGFVHADFIHLAVNMFVFYYFGSVVEQYFQVIFETDYKTRFLLLYLGAMVVSIIPTYRKHKQDPRYNALGASGAVSAMVFAFILFQPLQPLCLYGILCLPGIIFGVLYILYCYFAGKRGGDFINHDAHLWGSLCGFFFTAAMKPELLTMFLNQLPFFKDVF